MGLKKEQREKLKIFILTNIDKYPKTIAAQAANEFGISRQAVSRHIRQLKNSALLVSKGRGGSTEYELKTTEEKFLISIAPGMSEDQIWRDKIVPCLPKLNQNIFNICQHGFTEMFNNVIDHSESKDAQVVILNNFKEIRLSISDSGVGIFNKIQKALNLEDPRHAILELAKGKFTTDPSQHSGEGIFFTSRIFDDFEIFSYNLYFYGHKNRDWISEAERSLVKGTAVIMSINKNSQKQIKDIFDEYTSGENEYGFSKTKIPVKLMRYEGEELVSRSQAKRLIMRFDRFKEVILDFEGVKIIGQAFADEVFRVFKNKHPEVKLDIVRVNNDIVNIIAHVTAEH